jgi:adenine specific DNA methylase Mod
MTEDIRLIHSDNLEALRSLRKTHAGHVELIYMDPPFLTGKRQVGAAGSFEDPKVTIDEFTGELVHRCKLAWELLSTTGCLVVHLDSKTVHYVKVELDRAFGTDHFASEIIWHYRRWPTKTPNFQRVHDVLSNDSFSPARRPEIWSWTRTWAVERP